jgi:hypothetical protein
MEPFYRLSPQARAKLKTIWHEETGENLPEQEVDEMGWRLLRFFDLIVRASARRRSAPSTGFEPPSG